MISRKKEGIKQESQKDYVSPDFPSYMCDNPLILACHNNDYAAIQMLMPKETGTDSSHKTPSKALADVGFPVQKDTKPEREDAYQKDGGTSLLFSQISPENYMKMKEIG